MSKQRPDTFKYNDKICTILSISEPFEFTPLKYFGIHNIAFSTSCYRGFWCDYEVSDYMLKIKNLSVLAKDAIYPEINGINPSRIEELDRILIKWIRLEQIPVIYKGIDYYVDYTGKILIGIHNTNNGNGDYSNVMELAINHGQVMKETDLTEEWNDDTAQGTEVNNKYWWLNYEYDYLHLLTHYFMGA